MTSSTTNSNDNLITKVTNKVKRQPQPRAVNNKIYSRVTQRENMINSIEVTRNKFWIRLMKGSHKSQTTYKNRFDKNVFL